MALRVMVVDDHAERAELVADALHNSGYRVSVVTDNDVDLYSEVQACSPEVIIVAMDSPSRDTLEYIQSITARQPRPVVLFSKVGDQEMIRAAIQSGVSSYIVDGLQVHRLKPILDVAIERFREFQTLREELHKAKSDLAERKTIERAKGILMKKRGLSEGEAYKALRSLAMNRNKKLVEIAESILAAADLLG